MKGKPAEELLAQVRSWMEASTNVGHTGYVGHMDSIPSVASVVADLLAAYLNNNMLSLELSPAFTQLEAHVLEALAVDFGLPATAGGVMVSGGSLANLQAMAVARNQHVGSLRQGIWGLRKRPVFFASELAHTSFEKAAMLLGLGTESLVPVPTDHRGKMDVLHLQLAIERAEVAGNLPFAVVATVGTTHNGNIDPLPEIGRLAKERNLWFHVDAAYGGALIFSPRERERLVGIAEADSITFNPQKWLYVTKSSAMVLFRDRSILEKFFRIHLPYHRDGGEVVNRGEIAVQGTRHVDVLKLWLTLQHFGREGCASLIEQGCDLVRYVYERLCTRPLVELASEPESNILCFRVVPKGKTAEELDRINADLQAHLLSEGIYLSLPLYKGARWLRMVVLNPFTDRAHLDRGLELLDAFLRNR